MIIYCLNVWIFLREFPNLKDIIFTKYKYILADEFQDTNYIQYCLFKEICINSNMERTNVFVVGDKRQCIMKFQGANPENIKNLIEDFGCTEYKLEKNHRTSSVKIREITDRLRNSKDEIESKFEIYISINDISFETIDKLNSSLVSKITQLREKGAKLEDICILFPQDSASKTIKEKLIDENIKFISITDYTFKSIYNNYSDLFIRIENLIIQKIDQKSVNILIEAIIDELYPEETDNIILDTIKNFSNKFDRHEYSSLETWNRLQEFYNHLQLEIDWSKIVRRQTKDKLFLSTIHSAKGLEFKFILLIGIVNYQLPHSSTCADQCYHSRNSELTDISDDKDVFYVAISRSIEDIFFFFSKCEFNADEELRARKISCVFEDIYDLLRFIDIDSNNEFNHENSTIKENCCR